MTPKLLGKHFNTYTFTKDLSENLLKQESKNLPLAIVRPSLGKSVHKFQENKCHNFLFNS